MCHFPHLAWWAQYLHPGQLRTPCGGYWAWSGILSDIGEITLLGCVIAAYRHKNCYVKGCPWLGHIDPEHHHPACRKHHSHRHKLS